MGKAVVCGVRLAAQQNIVIIYFDFQYFQK